MDFWNTVLGNNLAHVLIQTLPELAENASKKKHQYGTFVPNDELVAFVSTNIKEGKRFVTALPDGESLTYVILEE